MTVNMQRLSLVTRQYRKHNELLEEKYGVQTSNLTPGIQQLSLLTKRYRDHNNRVEEGYTPHAEKCTTAELEIITRDNHYTIGKVLRRIERIEKKLGIITSPEEC